MMMKMKGLTIVFTFLCVLVVGVSGSYEEPPCDPIEIAVEIVGVTGVFCSPQCSTEDGSCPTDVPEGVTAYPQCALQSPTGESYCALLCIPSSGDFLIRSGSSSDTDSECGNEMSCEAVPDSGGVGICVYPMEEEEETNKEALALSFVAKEDVMDLSSNYYRKI